MKRLLSEAAARSIHEKLLERFGMPLISLNETQEKEKKVKACSLCHASGKISGRGTYGQPIRMKCTLCKGRGFVDAKPPVHEQRTEVMTCESCGCMEETMEEEISCNQCGMMSQELAEPKTADPAQREPASEAPKSSTPGIVNISGNKDQRS